MKELVGSEIEIDWKSSRLMLDYWFRSSGISMRAKDDRDMSQRLGKNPDPHSCMQTEHKQSDDPCVYRTERTAINALHNQN